MTMNISTGVYQVGNAWLTREMRVEAGSVRTIGPQALHEARAFLTSQEIELVLDAARWRYDIPHWRYTKSGPDGETESFHSPDFDDTAWTTGPHILPIVEARATNHHRHRCNGRRGLELLSFLPQRGTNGRPKGS